MVCLSDKQRREREQEYPQHGSPICRSEAIAHPFCICLRLCGAPRSNQQARETKEQRRCCKSCGQCSASPRGDAQHRLCLGGGVALGEARIDAGAAQVRLQVTLDSGPPFTLGAPEVAGIERYPRHLVDRLLDMCRTALNVTGDLVAATVIAAGEEDQP